MSEGSGWKVIRSNMDFMMLIITLALYATGVAAIYSASPSADGFSRHAARQLVWGGVSLVCYLAILRIGYKNVLKTVKPAYAVMMSLFLLLLVMGHTSKGAQSWFNLGFMRFQPSELGKVVFAMTLAQLCTALPPTDRKGLFAALLLSGVTIILILLEPDLGSSLVYCAMMFSVLIVAGTPVKYLLSMVAAGIALLPAAWFMLKPYQRMRLFVFINPNMDPQGAGYNVIQSRIAVGSGGLFGKGFLQGTQGKLHFLPEPHTDFIFSVFSEEFGFVGCFIVLLLFTALLWRMISVAKRSRDMKAKLMVTAITAWLWFQITESVAMSMGLAPVTGIPLPLFSYGGSALLAVMIGLALVQSVAVTSKEESF
jgi:rod shape determining protein RodA